MLKTVVVLAAIAVADAPKSKEPPPKEELAKISARGRDLAEYDFAAWHGSDAVQRKNPKPGSVARYIAHKTENGWTVAFGRLDDDQMAFLIAYEAMPTNDPKTFKIREFDPPRKDTGFFRSAARAIDTALKDFVAHFEGEQRPYNVAALPAENAQTWVYLFPAPTKPGVWPLGGDIRYQISADGGKIVEKRPLHKAIIEKPAPKANDANKLAMGFHTHVLDDVPQDTDVYHVVSRKPAVPELIRTEHFVFMIEPDGAIKYVGKADEVFKEK